jgi:hypothetical protein
MLDTTTRNITKCETTKDLQNLTYDAKRYRAIIGESLGFTDVVTIKYPTGRTFSYDVRFDYTEEGTEVLTVNGLDVDEVSEELISDLISQHNNDQNPYN